MNSTLLLRFRDLSCPRGETINRHKEIIRTKGYVWWGWWNKGHEKLPTETLDQLALKVEDDSDKFVYLFDSAEKKFYKATVLTYKAEVGSEIKAPDESHTPSYYIENTHPLWFKFQRIVEVDDSEVIDKKSYEQMDDLFKEMSHYEIYNHKIVASAVELAEQNRTIWRVRDKLDTDKTNEIRLKDMTELQPRHFDKSYKVSPKNSLLWLSDPHFTKAGFHGYPLEDTHPTQKTLAQSIQSAYFEKGADNIASLLISGDLTWKGDKEEFELAGGFIDHLNSLNNLDKSWLSICPGNHDLSFYEGADKTDSTIIDKNYQESRTAYSDFYARYFDIKPNESMSSGRRLLLNGSIPVEIVLLNSVTLQQTKGTFQGHGYIGEEQLDVVEKEMNFSDVKPRNVTRICVMHHHLMPVSLSQEAYHDAKYSTVLDAERLSRWLTKHKFDFLLHGHMHQNFNCTIERSIWTHKPTDEKENPANKLHVLSLGSSGVCMNHTGESKGNWTCRIEFGHEKIIFHYGKISPEDATLSEKYKLEFDYNG
ncbi:metallophosphoesterase [Vibrio parahaemolyticus]|uniref:metallophosphoesterase family protein n=1 Tax=Vibrio harveyi group TaxID=717610 RepID=UPI0010F045BA|nr:metallophosphoesterase [Vibrio parahaemolyticus]MCX8800353.1 metallophosphoesterase [Vibrio parahaemolyticus]TBT16700.1 metallophosphoesterase [Vibrio parahaemolyticus]HDY7465005.1 metallophosphoesterase [Vibrio vulnificus]